MIRNYFKIAFRSLSKNKLHAVINIGGLGLGLATCMLIMLYVAHEYSYDRFHTYGSRIYSIGGKIKMGTDSIFMNRMSYAAAPLLKQNDPGVESYIRLQTQQAATVIQRQDKPAEKFSEDRFILADSNFFNFFRFPLIKGDPASVLSKPFSVIISATAAKKYFGNEDPVGKTILYNNKYSFLITGIAQDAPSNSSIEFDFVASLSSIYGMTEKSYESNSQMFQLGSVTTFFLLRDKKDLERTKKAIQLLSTSNSKGPTNDTQYFLTPLNDLHFDGFHDSANLRYLKIFPLVAILVLLLALINYMSLATARATMRAKEIGVRKMIGALRVNIIYQFYIESALYALLAFAAGSILYIVLKPFFYNLLQLHIDNTFLYSKSMITVFAALLLITILGAGIYPSMFLSAYKPIEVISGKMSKRNGGAAVRKFFIVTQFAISVALIICGIIINRQLSHFRNTDTGLSRSNVLMIPFENTIGIHYQAFRKEVQSLNAIENVATAHYPMYKGFDMFFASVNNKQVPLPILTVDKQFLTLMNMQWKIPPSKRAEQFEDNEAVINETAISKLNLNADPMGQTFDLSGKTFKVAGVLKDFNFESLQKKIEALCVFVAKDTGIGWGGSVNGCLFAKINTHVNMPATIGQIKQLFEKYDKQTLFRFSFMDEAYNIQYAAEERLSWLFNIFTILTILIACMGLFGLVTFATEQRKKEIGIRKVLGASIAGIFNLVSKDFIKLIVIAILIASPVAWYVMEKWLQDFAYRINISWWIFALAGLTSILIALLTISFQAIKAAVANPVKSLRTE